MQTVIILDIDTAQVYHVIRTTASVEKLQKIFDQHKAQHEGSWTVEGVLEAFRENGVSFEDTKFNLFFV